MNPRQSKLSLRFVVFLVVCVATSALAHCSITSKIDTLSIDTTTIHHTLSSKTSNADIGAIFPDSKPSTNFLRHFSWGAEVGSSVDLTGNNLTTFDVNIFGGWKNSLFQVIGIGMGMHRSISNSTLIIPFYGIIRTSFRNKPSRFFFNLKAGYSLNTISTRHSKGGFHLSTGAGVILKRTSLINSYIMLAYGFYHINEKQVNEMQLNINHIDFAQIIFGISF